MKQQCYLAVDLGAESGRVMAGLLSDGKIQLEEVYRFSNGPIAIDGTLRWDVLNLWKEIQIGLTQAASTYGESIVSVGVDTWGVDYVLMSSESEIICQPYHYRDSRTEGMLAAATKHVPRGTIFAETGLQFMEINTLYQLLAMQKQSGSLLEMADIFLLMPDFFHWALCGSRVVEFTNATTTQCLHPTERNWSFEMLRKFDLPTDIFPPLVTPGTKLGSLREEVATKTGLKRIDVVAPPTHDTAAAVVAVPTEKTGTANWAYLSSGTWSLIGVEVEEAALCAAALKYNVTNEGGVDGTYRLLKNVMGLWLVQECKRSFERAGNNFEYHELVAAAEDAEPFRTLFNPDDPSFLSPEDMPTAIAKWSEEQGEAVPKTAGQFVRSALESLAFKYRVVLGWLEELTGETIDVIHIVGGGSQNELLNQFTANATGRKVIAGPVEATALGNVLIQARTSGEIGTLAEIRDVVRNSYELKEFSPQDQPAWEKAFERFCELTK